MPELIQQAVLTGDVVDSQRLDSARQRKLPDYLHETAAAAGLARFEVFRGDSWQALPRHPAQCLALALKFASHLYGSREIQTRIAIGIGAIDSLRRDKLSLSQGEAFVLSGRALNEMPKERRLIMVASPSLPQATRCLVDAASALLDAVSASWTAKQAQAVALAASGKPQKELAPRFNPPISPQAFGKHLASAQWKLVSQALESVERGLASALSASPDQQASAGEE